MASAGTKDVKTPAEFEKQPDEYREAVGKIVISHAINELYGAKVFDEPAIALAPTPYWKWLACRVAMEEYGHHVRFFRLGREIGIPEEQMLPQKTTKRPLSIFSYPLKTWEEFGVIKLVADLAEIIQVEDLLKCSYVPLRNVAKATMPEEKFHAAFGVQAVGELVRTDQGRRTAQAAVDRIFPSMPAFFGKAGSKNNEIYRKHKIKSRTNEEMRADYVRRMKPVVEKLGLTLPPITADE
ncbi:MAG: phenylacetate-CoA oxygenase subunit PaaI [Candidatus Eremiobacteraeota bacterium]|nr:phenylacetate-CoA oxygenase subunit PaaI [Candidatus Eremiobacteraeota bacterium]MBV8355524.1 phenylacetate-CoA oxygenase subunit PaaI [Candidatus Eremiobacteraeota bacterium]